jgi:hypothetical protein
MPTPDNPDEFYLLLALVVSLLPLQWYLGRKLHQKAAAGTSCFYCFFAISHADFHQIRADESEEFKATLKAYKRRYIYVMLPLLAGVWRL